MSFYFLGQWMDYVTLCACWRKGFNDTFFDIASHIRLKKKKKLNESLQSSAPLVHVRATWQRLCHSLLGSPACRWPVWLTFICMCARLVIAPCRDYLHRVQRRWRGAGGWRVVDPASIPNNHQTPSRTFLYCSYITGMSANVFSLFFPPRARACMHASQRR